LAALGAIAWIGHRYEWKVPKASELFHSAANGPAGAEFCEEHSVEEGHCIECNVKLAPKPTDFGWCAEHGITQCVYHHPELAQLKAAYIPSPADAARIAAALSVRPREANNSRCKLHERRIQFSSPAAVDKAGIEVAVAQQQPIAETIQANGRITYRNGSVAHLGSRVGGSVLKIEHQIGDTVHKGDLLAIIDSAEVGKAKEALVQAIVRARSERAVYERLVQLQSIGVEAGNKVKAAKALVNVADSAVIAAEQVLANLGLGVDSKNLGEGSPDELMAQVQLLRIPEHTFESLGANPNSNLFPLRASQDGVVVEVDAVPGEVITSQKRLFMIADLRSMTAILQVPAEEAPYLQLGQKMEFEIDGARSKKSGVLDWISPEMDPQTRTVQVRSTLDNSDGRLRANSFGTGHILLREEPKGIVVPSSALQWEGDCHVVFVRTKDYFAKDAPKFFEVRKVVPGVKTAAGVELIVGVFPGEVVAAKGSDILRSELLKNNLGAGCGCVDHAH
jgi:multidrug efflux pump subunit AcrA (membrane-fusion protein)